MFLSTLFLAAVWAQVSAPPLAQAALPAAQKREVDLPKDIPKWLAGGEHKDVPWKVHIEKPMLTYQQREVVKAVAKVSGSALQEKSAHRNLMFIIRVADENGKWLPGGNFVTQELEKPLHRAEVEMESEVLLRPGKYTLATIMYDSVLGEHNISFSPVNIPPVNNDPLPHMLDKVPAAEFVRGNFKGIDTFAEGRPYLPVDNHRPVQLELFVDLSARERHVRPPGVLYTAAPADTSLPSRFRRLRDVSYFMRIVQSASVLSALKIGRGCMLVSSFDGIKEHVVLEPTLAENVDWNKIENQEVGPDKDTISIAALQGRREAPSFVQKQFYALTNSPSCYSGEDKPIRIVVVLSRGLQFPDGSHKVKVESCDCHLLYLRMAETAMVIDDLSGVLSPLGPKVFEFSDPDHFRRKLADLIKEINTIAK